MLVQSSAAGSPPRAGSQYAQLSRRVKRVKQAGLLERRPGYYGVRIGVIGFAFVATWAVFVLVGPSWWQLCTAVVLAVLAGQARPLRGVRAAIVRWQGYLFLPLLTLEALSLHLSSVAAVFARRAQVPIRQFCREHGVEYCKTTLWQSWREVLRHLDTVGSAPDPV